MLGELSAPTHPRLRWERHRQWSFGEWAWMVIWRFRDYISVADKAFAITVSNSLKSSNYPDVGHVLTAHLLWLRFFVEKLIDRELMSAEEGSRNGAIVRTLNQRKEAGRMMEQRRLDEQLENDFRDISLD